MIVPGQVLHRKSWTWCILRRPKGKFRSVLAVRNFDVNPVFRSLALVVIRQALSQSVSLNPDYRIPFLIEVFRSSQCLYSNVVFLDIIGRAFEKFGGYVEEYLLEPRGAIEYPDLRTVSTSNRSSAKFPTADITPNRCEEEYTPSARALQRAVTEDPNCNFLCVFKQIRT